MQFFCMFCSFGVNGLNHDVLTTRKKIYILGVEKDSFFCHSHLQKASITASSENMPDSLSSAYRRNYYIFKQNFLSAHIRKYTHY